MELDIVSFDEMLISAVAETRSTFAAAPGFSFERQGEFKAEALPPPVLTAERLDSAIGRRFRQAMANADGVPVGIAEFRNVHVHARTGLIADLAKGHCYKGHLLNVTDNALGRLVPKALAWGGPAQTSLVVDRAEATEACVNLPSAVLATAPGYNVYGHWLLDFLPRLHRVRRTDFAAMPIIRLPDKGWAVTLADHFLDGAMSARAAEPAPWYFAERLIVPTVARYHHTLHGDSVRPAWKHLKDALLAATPAASGPRIRHVFVSRRLLTRKMREERQIRNMDAVEQAAAAAGFAIISPETLPLPEQARLFATAEVILGEDGSGLHNCIFANPGARLGVIGARGNIMHSAIAAIAGQKVHYIDTENCSGGTRQDGGTQVPLKPFKAALDALLA